MDEDCLFLNIWAPKQPGSQPLPVMVWIYGGSYIGGSASTPAQDGAALARRGTIVVSFNYRTGIFGFFSHPELSKENSNKSSGNYGIMDAQAALQWVQRNIAAFGGDPRRVTVFGVSSGASLATMLLISPQSKGLFHAAILESPGLLRPLTALSDGERTGQLLNQDLGVLRRTSAGELQKVAESRIPRVRALDQPRVYGPVVDGWLLPSNDKEALEKGAYMPVPIIVGDNEDEGRPFVANWPINSLDAYRVFLEENFGQDAERMLGSFCATNDEDVKPALARVFAETQFLGGVRVLASSMTKRQPRLWRYRFAPKTPPARLAATHGDEVPYVFGSLGNDATDADRDLSEMMGSAWTQFAKAFDPNAPGVPRWPSYRDGSILVWDAPKERVRIVPAIELDRQGCRTGQCPPGGFGHRPTS